MIPYYKIEANIRFRPRDVSQNGFGIEPVLALMCPRQGPSPPQTQFAGPLATAKMSERSGHEVGHLVKFHTIRGTRQHHTMIGLVVRTFGLERSMNIFRAQTLWNRGHVQR